jgi:hypothetical protein
MPVKKQISVVIENRVGALARVSVALTKKKVNILGLSVHELPDFGILRIVVDSPARARKVLTREKLIFSATDVLAIEMPNQPGGLAKIATKLTRAGININYMYACAAGDKALGIFKVSETSKADRLLGKSLPRS